MTTITDQNKLLEELAYRFETGMPFLAPSISQKAAVAATELGEKAPDTDLTVLIVYGMGFAHGYADQVLGRGAWDGFQGMDPRLVMIEDLHPVWSKVVDAGGYELACRAFSAASEILCDIPDEEFTEPFQMGCAKFVTIGYMNGAVEAAKDKKEGNLEYYNANDYRFDSLVEYSRSYIGNDDVKELLKDLIGDINDEIEKQIKYDIAPRTGAYRQYSVIPGDRPSFSVRAYSLGLVEGIVDGQTVLDDAKLPLDEERYPQNELFDINAEGKIVAERYYLLDEVPANGRVANEFIKAAFPAAQLVDSKFCRCGLPQVARLMGIDALKVFVDSIEDFLDVDMSNMDIYDQGELAVLNASLNVCTRQMGYGYARGWQMMLEREPAAEEETEPEKEE